MDELREKKLRQVRALIDKADDPATPDPERLALRQKADDLMLVYAITEFEADQRKPKELREKPEARYMPVVGENNGIKTQLIELAQTVIRHGRCMATYTGLYSPQMASKAHVVGFPSDIDYVELLYLSLQVQLMSELEPRVDPANSFVENLAMLKEAGLKWKRIHQLLVPDDPEPVTKAAGVRYTKLYTDYCKQNDRPRLRTSPQQYQRNYADGFVIEVGTRLRAIQDHQRQAHIGGEGATVALRDRSMEVLDLYKDLGAGRGIKLGGRSGFDASAYGAGKAAGSRADLGQSRMGGRKEIG